MRLQTTFLPVFIARSCPLCIRAALLLPIDVSHAVLRTENCIVIDEHRQPGILCDSFSSNFYDVACSLKLAVPCCLLVLRRFLLVIYAMPLDFGVLIVIFTFPRRNLRKNLRKNLKKNLSMNRPPL
jgi:hypothetical protein